MVFDGILQSLISTIISQSIEESHRCFDIFRDERSRVPNPLGARLDFHDWI